MNHDAIDLDEDGHETWVYIYETHGENGLYEYSVNKHDPDRGLGSTIEVAFLYRLAFAGSSVSLSEMEFYELASKLPENLRPFLIKNKMCPESLIEDLWVGNYTCAMRRSCPEKAISYAFWHNHNRMISIYERRPDLRVYVPDCLRRLVELSIFEQREAKFIAC